MSPYLSFSAHTSVWLAQLVNILSALTYVHLCVQEVRGLIPWSKQARLWLPFLQGRYYEEQLICSGVTATKDCGIKSHGREMVMCGVCSQRCKLSHVASYRLARAPYRKRLLFKAVLMQSPDGTSETIFCSTYRRPRHWSQALDNKSQSGAGFSSLGSALALNYSRLLLRCEFESRVGR